MRRKIYLIFLLLKQKSPGQTLDQGFFAKKLAIFKKSLYNVKLQAIQLF